MQMEFFAENAELKMRLPCRTTTMMMQQPTALQTANTDWMSSWSDREEIRQFNFTVIKKMMASIDSNCTLAISNQIYCMTWMKTISISIFLCQSSWTNLLHFGYLPAIPGRKFHVREQVKVFWSFDKTRGDGRKIVNKATHRSTSYPSEFFVFTSKIRSKILSITN